jgi:Protein of unknown function (DUF3108)
MRGFLPGVIVILTASAFVGRDRNDVYQPVPNQSFTRGELLRFRMTFGIFTVGRGSAEIQPNTFQMNDRSCYKVDIIGRTVGLVDWVADVDDHWGAYIDTVALVPHQFYRRIREGRYKKDEWTNFDHENRKIEVKVLDNKTGKMKEPKYFDAPLHVRDMIGGFLLLRTMDLSNTKVGDTLVIKGFFEDTFYSLRILYKGKDIVKTKAGKFRALRMEPIMPGNKIFDGENSVTAWFSDDRNRMPIKISAQMFIGSAGVELTSYSGVRNPVNLVQ